MRQTLIERVTWLIEVLIPGFRSLDANARTAMVESNVPMESLVESILSFGLIRALIMNFSGITVGSGFAGTEGQSSLFKYRYLYGIVGSAGTILGNDGTITVLDKESPYASGAVGSVGVTTLIRIPHIREEKYVKGTSSLPGQKPWRTEVRKPNAKHSYMW
jgi:delta24-sterol reductase